MRALRYQTAQRARMFSKVMSHCCSHETQPHKSQYCELGVDPCHYLNLGNVLTSHLRNCTGGISTCLCVVSFSVEFRQQKCLPPSLSKQPPKQVAFVMQAANLNQHRDSLPTGARMKGEKKRSVFHAVSFTNWTVQHRASTMQCMLCSKMQLDLEESFWQLCNHQTAHSDCLRA